MPTILIFVVGICLGTSLSAILMVIATYFDYTAELKKQGATYSCHCDTSEEVSDLVKHIFKHGGEDVSMQVCDDGAYKVLYKTTPDKAERIISDWFQFGTEV